MTDPLEFSAPDSTRTAPIPPDPRAFRPSGRPERLSDRNTPGPAVGLRQPLRDGKRGIGVGFALDMMNTVGPAGRTLDDALGDGPSSGVTPAVSLRGSGG